MSSPEDTALSSSYFVGQELNWDARDAEVALRVQLPFWLYVDNCALTVEVNGHAVAVSVRNDYVEIHLGECSEPRLTCAYIGPSDRAPEAEVGPYLENEGETAIAVRKCRTVLHITSAVNTDVLQAFDEGGKRRRVRELYLQSFCIAHIPVVREVIQRYRLATYDYHAFEVSPWDVPVWFITDGAGGRSIVLYPERGWTDRPLMLTPEHPEGRRLTHLGAADLQAALALDPSPGEYELLDALNLMERGDASGAVRRTATAIEVIVAAALLSQLRRAHPEAEARRRLARTTMNFPQRIRDYEALSGRSFPRAHQQDLRRTRKLRNEIVHGGLRLPPGEAGNAQRAVDTGRWIYNWFENRPDRQKVREKLIAKRSIGRAFQLFPARITESGVVVEKW
jgi:hypothetical protein